MSHPYTWTQIYNGDMPRIYGYVTCLIDIHGYRSIHVYMDSDTRHAYRHATCSDESWDVRDVRVNEVTDLLIYEQGTS